MGGNDYIFIAQYRVTAFDHTQNIFSSSIGIIGSIHFDVGSPVSYTHLAVYKRQEEATALELPMMEQNLPIIGTITTVSYTHLDVYKRQLLLHWVP